MFSIHSYAIFPNWKSLFKAFNNLICIVHLYFAQYNVIILGVLLSTFKTRCNLHISWFDMSLIRSVFRLCFIILKLDLNVKHWYKKNMKKKTIPVRYPISYKFKWNLLVRELAEVYGTSRVGTSDLTTGINYLPPRVSQMGVLKFFFWCLNYGAPREVPLKIN